ncbi:MAG: TonB-dependent receptor [Steroidobacteraceae bacterium]
MNIRLLTLALVSLATQPLVVLAQNEGLEEVVVTARKKSEDLLQTPLAVSVMSGEDIDVRGIVSLTDLANNTPGFQITSVNSGRNDRSFQQISLRGMTPSRTTSTLTATFIDGVPVSSANAVNSVNSPARVEILKGPQSAYFGRNAFAGAINVVTKEPGSEFGGDVSISAGSRSSHDFEGSIEGPLFSDMFGFRLTARSWEKDGSYDNLAVPGQTLGDQSSDVFSLTLTAKPTEKLNIKLFGMLSKDDDGPSPEAMASAFELRNNNGALNIPFNTGSTAGTVIVPSLANCTPNGSRPWICGAVPLLPAGFGPGQNSANTAALSASLASGGRRIISASDGVKGYGLVGEFRHAHLTVDWQIGDSGFTLSSLTGLNEYFVSEVDDLDNWDGSGINNPFPNGTTTFWSFPFLVEREERDFSQELRLSFDRDGPFSGLIGYSYLKTSAWSDLVNLFNEITVGVPIAARGATSVTAPPKAKTNSVFFGASFDVSDKLTLSFEGRQQRDEVESYTGATTLNVSAAAEAQYGVPAGSYAPFSPLVSRTFDNFLPRFIVDYQFHDDLMGYVSWSKGVNVPLLSFNTNFLVLGSPEVLAEAARLGLSVYMEPEKITNVELGLKGKFADGRISAALAIYRAKWADQQNSRTGFVVDGNGVPQIVSGVANTGEVIADGIELDMLAKASDHVTVQFAAAMNNSDIQSFEDPLVSGLTGQVGADFEGHKMPLAPKISANVGVQYDSDVAAWSDGSWFARADVSYKDKQFIDASNITWIRPRTQVNLRAGIKRGPLSVDAYVQNLFDDDGYVSAFSNSLLTPDFSLTAGGAGYVNLALPELRTYGVKIGYKF